MLTDIVNLLGDMDDPNARKALILQALHDCPVIEQIRWDEPAAVFKPLLVRTLLDYGECKPGKPAVIAVLEAVRDSKGADQHASYNALIRRLMPDNHPLQPGDVICDCTLVKPLGKGGNGEVWLAEQPISPTVVREVAVKRLLPKWKGEPQRLTRFREEPGAQMKLEGNPHVTTIYTVCDHGGLPAIVSQYVPGGSLDEHIQGRAFDIDMVCDWLAQVASALDAAHALNPPLYHRDVKPENILVRYGGDGKPEHLYLADFGLVFSDDATPRQSQAGEKVGTREYIAPEQVPPPYQAQKGAVTAQTDIYSLGVVAYELLTGRVPFTIPDYDPLKAHLTEDLPPDPHLADEVLRILQRACAKDPADRYASATEFVETLRDWEVNEDRLNEAIEAYFRERLAPWAKYLKTDLDELTVGIAPLDNQPPPEMVQADDTMPHTGDPVWGDPLAREGSEVFWDDDSGDALLAEFLGEPIQQPQTRHIITSGDYQAHDGADPQPVENVRTHLLTFERGVLLGKPGSGKSWTLQMVMFDFWRAWRKNKDTVRIPVFVPLNRFNGTVPFEDFIRQHMGTLARYYAPLKLEKRLLLLCDALNEMPNQPATLKTLREHLGDTPHYVVSCRVLDYQRKLNGLGDLEALTLHDLDLPAIKRFFQKYLGEQQGNVLWERAGGSDDLFMIYRKLEPEHFWSPRRFRGYTGYASHHRMWSGAALIPLSRNPFMANLVCRVFKRRGELPESRGDLFATIIDAALTDEANRATKRGEPFPDPDDVKDWLRACAVAMQEAKATVLAASKLQVYDAALSDAARRGGLLDVETKDETDWLRFTHQLFQEYFAASELLDLFERRADPTPLLGKTWWEPGVWRETAVILGEIPGEGRGPNEVAVWLAPYSPWLALIVVTENAEYQAGQAALSNEAKQALIANAQNKVNDADPRGRAAAYRVLGRPDIDADQRPGVRVKPVKVGGKTIDLPDIAWCEVPEGPFLMGSDKNTDTLANDDETPQQEITLPTYRVSQCSVTVAQYAAFMRDGGYTTRAWWTDAGWAQKEQENWTEPRYWNNPTYHFNNAPVVGVSWYEAYAFCQWLNARSREAGLLADVPDDWVIRLLTESEWEKAARGTDGRIYPYGNEYDPQQANTSDTGIGRPSAMGVFTGEVYPYGILDMSGNVYDWCQTKWRGSYSEPEDNRAAGTDRRVVRGGAFNPRGGLSRCAFRVDFNPPYSDLNLGLRVCCGAPLFS